MTPTPWEIVWIQTAIERYEETFPNRPSPSLADALAWHANQRGTCIAASCAQRDQSLRWRFTIKGVCCYSSVMEQSPPTCCGSYSSAIELQLFTKSENTSQARIAIRQFVDAEAW